ncbi:hypothetical protein NIES2119_00080 [[Phormidium ambiguum] IAM M-71]|uniref:Uncharacterized protein n=1 Tax=[Phormidium ambiguum] IAM M-71 TaxID=454136 RepID=A0A1U7ITE6_9CYAN|nr:hypothetical protein [Phormidium ambiguum]OKH40755.1 hypothetical protein NIES2119_00080 [Phormidium ambiguum IAM M-71]
MSIDRLREVEEFLQMLREQRRSLEKEILLTTGLQQTQAEQRLRKDIKPKLREYETEYWQILASESETVAIPEPEIEVVIAEIVEQTAQLQTSPEYSDKVKVLEWLQRIHAEVSKPGTPAAAKLKGTLSLMPPFVNLSYEAELDTENFLRTNFPTFTKLYEKVAKKS